VVGGELGTGEWRVAGYTVGKKPLEISELSTRGFPARPPTLPSPTRGEVIMFLLVVEKERPNSSAAFRAERGRTL
jgi:hypothetical protein